MVSEYSRLHRRGILSRKSCHFVVVFGTPKGGRGCLMYPCCLESQGCHLILLSYRLSCFFCLVLLLFLSCHFSANGPFSRLFFSRKLSNTFRSGLGLFVWHLLSSCEMIVGRWYVSLLPYGTGICHYAFTFFFKLYCVCPFLFYIFL